MQLYPGRHRCLWCLIGSDTLKIPRQDRGRHTLRTLPGITEDLNRFLASGGNIKNAKHFNNVMGSHFFDVDLDNVSTILINNDSTKMILPD